MWQDTLLIWMGEFGRTPTINGQNGRDHFPAVTPVVLGGGCLRTGQVVGQTNRGGTQIKGDSRRVADLAATILTLLGKSNLGGVLETPTGGFGSLSSGVVEIVDVPDGATLMVFHPMNGAGEYGSPLVVELY